MYLAIRHLKSSVFVQLTHFISLTKTHLQYLCNTRPRNLQLATLYFYDVIFAGTWDLGQGYLLRQCPCPILPRLYPHLHGYLPGHLQKVSTVFGSIFQSVTWDICQDIFQLPGTFAGAITRVTPCLLGQLGWDITLANVSFQVRYSRSPTRMLIKNSDYFLMMPWQCPS